MIHVHVYVIGCMKVGHFRFKILVINLNSLSNLCLDMYACRTDMPYVFVSIISTVKSG